MVVMELKAPEYKKALEAIDLTDKSVRKAVKKAITKGTRDAPKHIVTAITSFYGIKKSDPEMTRSTGQAKAEGKKWNKKQAGMIKVKGTLVGSIRLLYEGRRLTFHHFGLKWSKKKDGSYNIRATIIKGQRKTMRGKYQTPLFMAPQQTGVMLPFQRIGKKRLPVYVTKTVGIPQMVNNKLVRPQFEQKIDEMLAKHVNDNMAALLPQGTVKTDGAI